MKSGPHIIYVTFDDENGSRLSSERVKIGLDSSRYYHCIAAAISGYRKGFLSMDKTLAPLEKQCSNSLSS